MADANAKLVQGSTTGTPLPSLLTNAAGTPAGTGTTRLIVDQVGVTSLPSPLALNGPQYPADQNNAAHPTIAAVVNHDGSNYNVQQSNQDATLLASGAQTTTFTITDSLINQKGVVLYVNVSAVSGTTPSLTVKLQAKDPVSGLFFDIPAAATAAITVTGQAMLAVYPGITVVANQAVSQVVPRTYRVVGTITGTTPSFTLSIGVARML